MRVHFLILAIIPLAAALAADPDGAALYKARCATCHEGQPQPRMPSRQELAARTPEAILQAMIDGAMKTQSAGLTTAETRAIARFVSSKDWTTGAPTASAKCAAPPAAVALNPTDWNGWGLDLANTRYQPAPGLTAADVPRLQLKWAFAFPGDTVRSAQPTVVAGRVFTGSASGAIYSLDAATGCTWWKYDAGSMVRTAITIGSAAGKTIAFFGDVKATVHALDAATGQLLWKLKVEDHPASRITGAPAFYNGRVYVPVSSIEEASAMAPTYECCKFRGSVVALDAVTGHQFWKSFSVLDEPKPIAKSSAGTQLWGPAGASIWSAPTIDPQRKVLYVGTGNSYTNASIPTSDAILAIDLDTGKLVWSKQAQPKDNFTMSCTKGPNCPAESGPDFDFGTSPILRDLPGGKRVLVCGQKSAVVWGLDPDDNGKVLWQTRVGQGGPLGGIEWGSTADLDNAYVAVSDLTSTPPNRPGGLHAVKLATGEKIWTAPPPELHCAPGSKGCNSAQSAAISSMPGIVFSGSIDGHLRAFSAKTGEIVWDYDTAHDYTAINGVPGKGGSLDSAGPVVAHGMLFTNSGYGMWAGMPGNVLLAFGK